MDVLLYKLILAAGGDEESEKDMKWGAHEVFNIDSYWGAYDGSCGIRDSKMISCRN